MATTKQKIKPSIKKIRIQPEHKDTVNTSNTLILKRLKREDSEVEKLATKLITYVRKRDVKVFKTTLSALLGITESAGYLRGISRPRGYQERE